MQNCSKDHRKIAFEDGGECPLCEVSYVLGDEIDDLLDKIAALEKE